LGQWFEKTLMPEDSKAGDGSADDDPTNKRGENSQKSSHESPDPREPKTVSSSLFSVILYGSIDVYFFPFFFVF
jgi:hypothetical protein